MCYCISVFCFSYSINLIRALVIFKLRNPEEAGAPVKNVDKPTIVDIYLSSVLCIYLHCVLYGTCYNTYLLYILNKKIIFLQKNLVLTGLSRAYLKSYYPSVCLHIFPG